MIVPDYDDAIDEDDDAFCCPLCLHVFDPFAPPAEAAEDASSREETIDSVSLTVDEDPGPS